MCKCTGNCRSPEHDLITKHFYLCLSASHEFHSEGPCYFSSHSLWVTKKKKSSFILYCVIIQELKCPISGKNQNSKFDLRLLPSTPARPITGWLSVVCVAGAGAWPTICFFPDLVFPVWWHWFQGQYRIGAGKEDSLYLVGNATTI